MESLAAAFCRQLFRVPGGYYVVNAVRRLLERPSDGPAWRVFSFRGIRMKVDVSREMAGSIFWRGSHDWGSILAMERLVRPGSTVVDVGANQGEYTIWAARAVGRSGRVVAFEPFSDLYHQLVDNINLNPGYPDFVTALQRGLSDEPQELTLYGDGGANEGLLTLFPAGEMTVPKETVSLSTLDADLELLGIDRINFLKVDVEGGELPVLRGGTRAIERSRPVLMVELNRTAASAAGYDVDEIVEWLQRRDYSLWLIGRRGKLSRLDPGRIPEFCNVIAKP